MAHDEEFPGDPPCHAHKIVDGHLVDPQTFNDVNRFRKSERSRLYARRRQMPSSEREAATEALSSHLLNALREKPFDTIAVYWPIRGEPDLRAVMARLCEQGKTVLLPVVAEKHAPLVSRPWHPGCDMVRGLWNIPVPAGGAAQDPDIVVAPLVGVDTALHRLGNGGGYYDRTLASLPVKPLVVGVGFSFCRIATIFPMSWDIPMDAVVTEEGPHE